MAIKINNVTVIDDSKKFIPSTIEAQSTVGTAGSVLSSTGSGLEWIPDRGGLTVISSVNANNSTSIAFTSGITTDYDSYVIYGYDIVPDDTESTFKYLSARFSTNYGSSYINADYYYVDPDYTILSYLDDFNACIIPPSFVDFGAEGIENYSSIDFVWYLHNLNDDNKPKYSTVQSYAEIIFNDDGVPTALISASHHHVGIGISTSPINAINFFMNTGNIISGNFRLCGISNS